MINPNEIRWVSNTRTKPLANQLNLLPKGNKCDYPDGCTIVKLTNIKRNFPYADVRFDNGQSGGLCYLHHFDGGQYQKDPTTNMWVYVQSQNPPPPEEAYQHSITTTYNMSDESLIELTEQMIYIKKVLIHNIL